MGRSTALVLALLLMASSAFVYSDGATASAPVSSGKLGFNQGSIWLNITSPSQGSYTSSDMVTVTWEGNDTGRGIDHYEIKIDDQTFVNMDLSTSRVYEGLSNSWHTVVVRAYNQDFATLDAPVSFFVDTMPPELSINYPGNSSFLSSSNVTVRWTGSDASGITHYQYKIDSEDFNNVPQSVVTHAFNGLSDGSHTVTIIAHDGSGKTTSKSVTFTVDTTIPTLHITSPANGTSFKNTDVMVVWLGTDADFNIDHYEVWLNDALIINASSSSNLYTVPSLKDGTYTVRVVAVDKALNTATDSITFFVDTQAPTVSITSPPMGGYLASGSATVQWTGDGTGSPIDHYEVRVDGGSWTSVARSTSHAFGSLTEGPHTVEVKIFDGSGNTATASVTFTVDMSTPSVLSHGPTGSDVGGDALITVGFSEAMDRDSVQITINGVTGNMYWEGNNLTFTPTGGLPYATQYTVTVTGKDMVGHDVTYQWTFSTTSMGLIQGRVLDRNGNPLAGATVTLDNGPSVVTNETGYFSFQAQAGEHKITISKIGYDTRTSTVTISSGQIAAMGDVKVSPSELVPTLGWVIAIIAVVIVCTLVFLGYRRRKMRGPPSKSWKGAEQLQERSRRGKRPPQDEL
jgi:hypothetical protein